MNDSEEYVIIVDAANRETGVKQKLLAHEKGLLHRAFSIYIWSLDGKFLLQKRAKCKYHSGGLWTNACCGHPRPGENTTDAAHRRLQEEIGIDCEIKEIPSMIYQAELPLGMIEHEFLHIFIGTYSGIAKPNPEEVEETRWIEMSNLEHDLEQYPDRFTAWIKICLPHVLKHTTIA
jgi:isopentenyl-diphosphate Delta-isomerase